MKEEEKLKTIINILLEPMMCDTDGTRIRFGDLECPRCGSDIDHLLQGVGENILSTLKQSS